MIKAKYIGILFFVVLFILYLFSTYNSNSAVLNLNRLGLKLEENNSNSTIIRGKTYNVVGFGLISLLKTTSHIDRSIKIDNKEYLIISYGEHEYRIIEVERSKNIVNIKYYIPSFSLTKINDSIKVTFSDPIIDINKWKTFTKTSNLGHYVNIITNNSITIPKSKQHDIQYLYLD